MGEGCSRETACRHLNLGEIMTEEEFKREMQGLIDMGLVKETKPGYYALNLFNNKKEKDNGKDQKSG